MHPVVFIPAFTSVGILFALQEWVRFQMANYPVRRLLLFESWTIAYLTWAVICWLVWRMFGAFIKKANLSQIVILGIPLSIAASLSQEMITVALFPSLPVDRPAMDYWQRLVFYLRIELLTDLVIFWCAFLLFRGIAYYQQFREKEQSEAQLQVDLANARLSALRMQLNPHFLFNAMNSISSMMRSNVEAADAMLEQLSSLLRMTLERGDVQLITIEEEMAFIEAYLAVQGHRYSDRVVQRVLIEPDLHDALVPAMILQPLVENAFAHGLSRLTRGGELSIAIRKRDHYIMVEVKNNGARKDRDKPSKEERKGVGLENVKRRLRLHYGEDSTCNAFHFSPDFFLVSIKLPLQFAARVPEKLLRYD